MAVVVTHLKTLLIADDPTASAAGEALPSDWNANHTVTGLGTLATQNGTFSGTSSGTNTGDQTSVSGNAGTVTTNANLTGPITSVGNATSIASQTGTGSTVVVDTSPTLVTPVIGAATGTSLVTTKATGTATSVDGLVAATTDVATVGAQKWSPRLRWSGSGWKTTATAAAQTVDWIVELQPIQGAAAPTASFAFSQQINGGGYLNGISFRITSASVATIVLGANGIAQNGSNLNLGQDGSGFDGVTLNYSSGTGVFVRSDSYLGFTSGQSSGTKDTAIGRNTAGLLEVNSATAGTYRDIIARGHYVAPSSANGQSLGILCLTELTTIAAAATTDTAIQMPAGALVYAVSLRVTAALTCTTNFNIGDSGSATRFGSAISKAVNTTNAGTVVPFVNASALSIRITPDTTPSDNTGRVRITIYYMLSTPPSS